MKREREGPMFDRDGDVQRQALLGLIEYVLRLHDVLVQRLHVSDIELVRELPKLASLAGSLEWARKEIAKAKAHDV